MRKRIFVAVLSTTLLMPGLLATRGERAGRLVRSGFTFTKDTAKDACGFITARNLALLALAYYGADPAIRLTRHVGNRVINYGKGCRLGIGKLSTLAAWLFNLPGIFRRWVDEYTGEGYAPANHTHGEFAAANHTHNYAPADHRHPDLAAAAHTHPDLAKATHDHEGSAKQLQQLQGQVTTLEEQIAGLLKSPTE